MNHPQWKGLFLFFIDVIKYGRPKTKVSATFSVFVTPIFYGCACERGCAVGDFSGKIEV